MFCTPVINPAKKMLKFLLVLTLFSSTVCATPVNINTADAQTISKSLIGVSLKKSEAIVINREKNGVFKNVDDLKRVIGIGDKTIAINRTNILLTAPKTAVIPLVVNHATPLPSHSPTNKFSWVAALPVLLLIASLIVVINHYYPRQKALHDDLSA